jgi:excisionase family DNA binding protein
MEKICIVKLRRKMANPVHIKEERVRENHTTEGGILKALAPPLSGNRNIRAVHDGSGTAESNAAGTVSVTLTPEQMRTLRSNPCLASSLNGGPAEGFETGRDPGKTIVVKFEFAPISPLRLLKVKDVIHMLQMSRGYLNRVIKQGALRSYRFGRLRRIMLDDVLSYLEANREFPGMQQRDLQSKMFHNKRV